MKNKKIPGLNLYSLYGPPPVNVYINDATLTRLEQIKGETCNDKINFLLDNAVF